jgi:zinc-ribbon domain
MRLFRSKRDDDRVEERCPQCGEPVPDRAVECMMCGVDLRPLRGARRDGAVEPSEAGTAVR